MFRFLRNRPPPAAGDPREMRIQEVEVGRLRWGYRPVRLATTRGAVACRYYPSPGARRAALWVGGIGGGWDTPARGLYPRLCRELQEEGIASLRVRYRYRTDLRESVLDLLAGLAYLHSEGIAAAALTGHSFGGAVVIRAAALSPAVRAVVTLATQSYGTEPVSRLAGRCALLLIHGTADRRLPPACSETVFHRAPEPKRLLLYEGAGHSLREVAAPVHQAVRDWILQHLADAGKATA